MICGATYIANAQVVPSVQFGLKAGMNLTKLNTPGVFSSDNQAGFLGGVWFRFGAAGIHLQPELYVTTKNTNLESNSSGEINEVKFTSIDVPVLIGTKIGAVGVGVRLNTGPVISFIIDENQTFGEAASNITRFSAKNQAFAWQFGTGLDIRAISVDLRYELGLSKVNKTGFPETKLNLFHLALGYKF
ncbi:MAG: PorT family protein [Sphingobacteriales bacterium]|nr:MAG: PorT family protein [Sphingobacteriales bacterium]